MEEKSLDAEEWRPVARYEGYYEVSNLGRIKRIVGGRGAVPGRIRRLAYTMTGYRQIILYRENFKRGELIHRIVAEAFIGPIPEGYEVNHKNGIKADNRVENLEIVSGLENMRHAAESGLLAVGEERSDTKLKDADVLKIRYELVKSMTCEQIARHFGVSRKAISLVLRGKTYKHCVRDQQWVNSILKDRYASRYWTRKLTDDQVYEIRRLQGSATQKELGERFGVHPYTIGSIWRRNNWAHLPEE